MHGSRLEQVRLILRPASLASKSASSHRTSNRSHSEYNMVRGMNNILLRLSLLAIFRRQARQSTFRAPSSKPSFKHKPHFPLTPSHYHSFSSFMLLAITP